MIKSYTLDNFRCFKHVELNDLGTINLLVGQNGSGKTAFLESLYLAIGAGPALALRIRRWRGLPGDLDIDNQASFQDLWADLFFHFKHDANIVIEAVDSNRSRRVLNIAFRSDENYLLPLIDAPQSARPVPLDFEYRVDAKDSQHAIVEVSDKGITIGGIRSKDTIPGVFFSSYGHHGANTVKRFSEMIKDNREKDVLLAIQEEFPQIMNLSMAEDFGSPVLFATVAGIPERKMPLELVSMGIHKYLGILLALMASPKGIVIVDEIDAGLYHSQLSPIWRQFLNVAKKYKVQMFCSTHSAECISSLADALKETPEDLRILHLKRENGESTVVKFSGKDAISAICQGFEVR